MFIGKLKNYNLKLRVKAASLLETTFSLGILSLCLAIALIVISRSISLSKTLAWHQAKTEIQTLLFDVIYHKNWSNHTFHYPSFKITKKIHEYQPGLRKVNFRILTKSKEEGEFVYYLRHEKD